MQRLGKEKFEDLKNLKCCLELKREIILNTYKR